MNALVSLRRRGSPLTEAQHQVRILETLPLSRRFGSALEGAKLRPLSPLRTEVLQMNVGKVCNQTCAHCHVDAAPDRKEVMPDEVVNRVLEIFERTPIPTLDITGGAPELHPRFREIVRRAAATRKKVLHRCNLTAILAKPFSDLPELLAEHRVEIVASLPHYKALSTDRQRGEGVFERSIEGLGRLNGLGYGRQGSGLVLDLVTNPVGAFLPGNQASLEREWKRELLRRHGVEFNRLFVLTNMPISRFLDFLLETNNLEHYMSKLVNAFNPAAAAGVMCRNTLSVGWQGELFDCDFNQMLEIGVSSSAPRTVFEFDLSRLERREIAIGEHCYGCTAGAGSSCGGQTASS
ncbi:MAG: arsenosugar biosynthesis radical SAM protein ArsS [Deltaproteobacteria bacterium]|nr:arsenosugar biosynthesis radical SAM protein ArsS [Deltaproteobacteria bacterium]